MSTLAADWQRQLATAFTSVDDLCRHLKIAPSDLPLLTDYPSFPLRVPRSFVDCMKIGDPTDPLLRQILPLQLELQSYPGYVDDPVGDLPAIATAGVLHKYQRRLLLIVTGSCAVNCRYCFRRNFPYGEQQLSTQRLDQATDYIKQHTEISEVILSGGDPLLLSDDKLEALLQRITSIPHVTRIRIHSRIPVVLPARITDRLLKVLGQIQQPVVLVLHANHGNELSPLVAEACRQLRARGVTLLNQSVLLAQVNDDSATLEQLSERLFTLGVLPYYLHLLDKARGVGHFAVSESHGHELIRTMQQRLPGYLVPKLVKEEAGAAHKISLS